MLSNKLINDSQNSLSGYIRAFEVISSQSNPQSKSQIVKRINKLTEQKIASSFGHAPRGSNHILGGCCGTGYSHFCGWSIS